MTAADGATGEAEVEAGRLLFARPCEFRYAAGSVDRLPPPGPPEIAFAGRSNAGKSSLVNALTGRKTLARTSRTPGRTQELIFFDLDGKLMLVDMPGYGYAAAPLETVKTWSDFARDYLRGRRNLMRIYLLTDARHGLKAADLAMLDILDKTAVSYQLVLTKVDQLKQADIGRVVAEAEAVARKHGAAHPRALATSSLSGFGIPDLRAEIAALL